MLIREIIWVALGAIRANALRSFLTTLGIIIGVSAVIAMVALGEGAQRNVEEQISRMGTNVLTIRADQRRFGGVSTADTEDLKVDDAEALRSEAGGLLTISPEISSRVQLSYLRWNSNNQVRGVWPEYFGMYNLNIEYGEIFDQGHVQGRRRVAVLGFSVSEALGTPAPLLVGKTIQVRGQPFEVIGVLEEKGAAGFNRPDDEVYVPDQHRPVQSVRGPQPTFVDMNIAQVSSGRRAEADGRGFTARSRRILGTPCPSYPRRGKTMDFRIRATPAVRGSWWSESFNATTPTFVTLLRLTQGIAGIPPHRPVQSGSGYRHPNICVDDSTERTLEIGERKALGARRVGRSFVQFLIEALVHLPRVIRPRGKTWTSESATPAIWLDPQREGLRRSRLLLAGIAGMRRCWFSAVSAS